MKLEPGNPDFKPTIDRRPLIPQPLPVKLVAVEDVHLPTTAGLEAELDDFYIRLLKFERAEATDRAGYRAENFYLWFDVSERPVDRETMRAQEIEIESLAEMEHLLIDEEIEYQRQKGVTPGRETLLLRDPAGNWVELSEMRIVG